MRKSRTSARNNNFSSPLRKDSSSPAPTGSGIASSSSINDASYERRTANEQYFSTLGEANANRREDLPPSQGGKYQGFGSTPAPSSSHPSYGTSSANLPTLEELQTQPVAALSKSWSLLSAAVTAASKVVAEKAMDPALHESVKGYAAQASKIALDSGKVANEWSKRELGVDVADKVVGVADKAKGALGYSSHPGGGYESVEGASGGGYGGWHDENGTRLYADGDGDDDFFDANGARDGQFASPMTPGTASSAATGQATPGSAAPLNPGKKAKDWDKDEWQDW
jgi:ADP-ribosylation factor GTPase-activating protein 1